MNEKLTSYKIFGARVEYVAELDQYKIVRDPEGIIHLDKDGSPFFTTMAEVLLFCADQLLYCAPIEEVTG